MGSLQIITGEHNHFKSLIVQFPDRLRRVGFELIGYRDQTAKLIFACNHHHRFALGLQPADPAGGRFDIYVYLFKPIGFSHPYQAAVDARLNSQSAGCLKFLWGRKRYPLGFGMLDDGPAQRVFGTFFDRCPQFQKILFGLA